MDESSINKLNRIWHQLEPWEDSVEGLDLLNQSLVLALYLTGTFHYFKYEQIFKFTLGLYFSEIYL